MLAPGTRASLASLVAALSLAATARAHTREASESVTIAFAATQVVPRASVAGGQAEGTLSDAAAAAVVAAESALRSSDTVRARTETAAAVTSLLACPLSSRDPNWSALMDRAGLCAWKSGDVHLAASAWESVLEVRSRDEPVDSSSVQQARSNLAAAWSQLGDFAGARRLYETVLEVRERALPHDHPDLLSTRTQLGTVLSNIGELQAARVLRESVLESRIRTRGTDHPDTVAARAALALTLKLQGDLAGARALEESVLASRTRVLAPDHPDVLAARQNLAATLLSQGDVAEARAHYSAVLEARMRTLPADSVELRVARANLAVTAFRLGDLEGARRLQEEVLAACVSTLPPDHPYLSAARTNLAATLYMQGDIVSARELQEAVLDVYSRTLHPDHPDLHRLRTDLANTLEAQGDLLGARVLRESALAALERTLPSDHPDVLRGRANLVQTMQQQAEWREARRELDSLLESAKSLPETDPERLRLSEMMARTLRELGDLQGARVVLTGVVDSYARTLPETHPYLLRAQAALAAVLHALGDFEAALTLREVIYAARSSTLDADHDDVQVAASNLAAVLIDQASCARSGLPAPSSENAQSLELARAVELLKSLSRSRARVANQVRRSASGREAEARCATLASSLSFTLSVGLGYGGLTPMKELWPEIFLQSEATRNAAVSVGQRTRHAEDDPEYERLRAGLRTATDELVRLVQRGSSREEFLHAQAAREQAERHLLELAGSEMDRRSEPEVDTATLSAHLDPGVVALAFRRFSRFDVTWGQAPGSDPLGPSNAGKTRKNSVVESLCVFLVHSSADAADRKDTALELVDLGSLAEVEKAVRAWQIALGVDVSRGLASNPVARDAIVERGNQLRHIVLDPLLQRIGEARHVIVVLDDVLHLLPLEALPLGQPGPEGKVVLAGDRYQFEVRATLRELLEPAPKPSSSNTLLALGGPSFNSEPQPLDTTADESTPADPVGSSSGPMPRAARFERSFEPLPFTGEEARGVAALHAEVFEGGGTAVVLEKRKASRSALSMLAPSARWLHVATHGWTMAPSTLAWDDPRPGRGDELALAPLTGAETLRGMSPMLLCGLALAGSNLPPDSMGHARGLLTAEELAALDLSGCELAVLSACDSARGEMRRAGQGVASMQKALQIAGARSVITSLWKVPDEATKELLLDFYRRVWVERVPKWRALWEAKRRLREALDERGESRYQMRDWAAWVLTGEPD